MTLEIIDIYYPSFTEKMRRILGAEVVISDDFNSYFSNQRFKMYLYQSLDRIRPYLSRDFHEREDAFRAIGELANALEECRKIIADIVKENWEFKELIELDSTGSYPKNRLVEGFVVRQAHHERVSSVRPEPVEGRD